MYRFIVAVDIEAEALPEAYGKLLDRMNANDWESTDEVYGPDGGEEVDVDELQQARLAVLGKRTR